MNLYRVKLKAAEDGASVRTYDILADDIEEAARKAMKHHHDKKENYEGDPHRIVNINESARNVV